MSVFYSEQHVQTLTSHQFAFLQWRVSSHVLTLTLNRPEKKNALNTVLTNELAFAMAHAQHNPDIWVVVLAAKGDIFCAGADLKAFAGETQTSSSTIPDPLETVRLGDVFANLCKPCIANVHAPVYAGGFLLIGGCTYVVAAENATFSLPEVKRGLFPFQVMASLLPSVPARTVLDWCVRARTLSAQEAQQAGLVSMVVPADALNQAVDALVADILQYSPKAIQMGLQAYQELQKIPAEERHAYLQNMLQQVLQTEDAAEGIAAFAEKRKPIWKGK